jgi:hypothetical protein
MGQKIYKKILKKLSNKKFWSPLLLLLILAGSYYVLEPKLSINPNKEVREMELLDKTKKQTELSKFKSDGCSGNISSGWTNAPGNNSIITQTFYKTNSNTERIPFESACIKHDRTYHKGVGGYVGRFIADNQLRSDIISYGIENSEEIKSRVGLKTEAEAILLYELIAEAIYRGVRLGGAPCTGEPYAWGFGYGGGECVDS